MLFHLGSLKRLNDAGMLRRVDAISSVSGGSIVAGTLGAHWNELTFDAHGKATNFDEVVVRRVRALASHTIDVPAILTALTMPRTASQSLAGSYEKYLVGDRTLADLPVAPKFYLNATNLKTGHRWVFSRNGHGDFSLSGFLSSDGFPLSVAITASSAFPPFLSPVEVEVPPNQTAFLADGGVYDNLGLEPRRRYATVLVSDGSARVLPAPDISRNWFSQLSRAIDIIYDQPGVLRKRVLVTDFVDTTSRGAYWSIKTSLSRMPVTSKLCIPVDVQRRLAALPTRLKAVEPRTQELLMNWGYLVTDISLRSYVLPIPEAKSLPYRETGGPCKSGDFARLAG